MQTIPENLQSLRCREEELRREATMIVANDERLQLHLSVTERAMNMAELFRKLPMEDEDMRVVQVLGMRAFNGFAASLNLAFSGYGQNSFLVMRDILETAFLLDLFNSDRSAIRDWRFADKKTRMKEFSPVQVRKNLDARDGFEDKRRGEHYVAYCEFAAHPTMQSDVLMRPQPDGDAVIGPFLAEDFLKVVLTEMATNAIQIGEALNSFLPETDPKDLMVRETFLVARQKWLEEFMPDVIDAT